MKITEVELLYYECCASWWASWVWFSWGQALTADYYVWKTRRKYARYKMFAVRKEELEQRLKGDVK